MRYTFEVELGALAVVRAGDSHEARAEVAKVRAVEFYNDHEDVTLERAVVEGSPAYHGRYHGEFSFDLTVRASAVVEADSEAAARDELGSGPFAVRAAGRTCIDLASIDGAPLLVAVDGGDR
jgi:hypothetical protein